MPPREKFLLEYGMSLEARQFSNAMHIYEEIRAKLKDDEWSRGYLQALKGIYLVKRSDDQYAFFSKKNIEIEELKRFVRRFLKNTKSKLLPEFDKGYFTAAAEYTKALIKMNKKKG